MEYEMEYDHCEMNIDEENTDEYIYYIGLRRAVSDSCEVILSNDFFLEVCPEHTKAMTRFLEFRKLMPKQNNITQSEICQYYNVEPNLKYMVHILDQLSAIKIRMQFNPDITCHKFNTSLKMKREDFDTFIQLITKDKKIKQQFMDAKITI